MENYPKTALYKVIDTNIMPHPYCITTGHVVYASDHCNGLLSPDNIKAYETKMKRGCCGVKNCQLNYAAHETVILIQVDFPGELKDAPGLQDYLKSCIPNMKKLNHAGFLFIKKETKS